MSDMVSVSPQNPEVNPAQPPAQPKTSKALLAIVIALGALILVGLGALIAGIMLGGNNQSADTPAQPAATAAARTGKPVSMTLSPGYKILSSDTQPGRLILHIRSTSQDEIDVIDLNDGHIISQIHAEAPQ